MFAYSAYLLPAAFAVHAVCFWGRGVIDEEAMEFTINYLRDRPLLAMIFDPNVNEWGLYQARELSYLFDFIDTRFFAALLDRHILLFVPLSGVVGLVTLGTIFIIGARKILSLDHVTISLILSLFLSCIGVQASTAILYRSSKIALSVVLIAFLFWITHLLRNSDVGAREKPLRLAGLYGLGTLMALCDRQGFFFLVTATVIIGVLGLARFADRSPAWRNRFQILIPLLAAVLTSVLYNHVIAPVIIQSLNGYWPSFDYQHLPLGEILDRSLPAKAWQMFSTQVSFFLGNLPFVVVLGLVAIVVWTTKRNVAGPPRERRGIRRALMSDGAIVTLLSVAALNVLLLLMVARHPYVYSIADHWFWYYPLTLDVVFLFGLATWVPSLGVGNRPGWKSALWISLVILLALNVAYYPQQRQIMIRSTDWFERQWAHSQFFVKKFEWMEAHGETFAPPSDTVGTPRDVDGFLEAVHAKHDALRHRPNSPAADSR